MRKESNSDYERNSNSTEQSNHMGQADEHTNARNGERKKLKPSASEQILAKKEAEKHTDCEGAKACGR
jgi:hypothetical protein